MTQPTPNHQPPGKAAPRYVEPDERTDAEFERDMYLSLAGIEEWAAKERHRQRIALIALIKLMPLAIIAALGLAVAVYAIAKTQAGVGL